MVTSSHRALANQKNAIKSTGPRTTAGKASSSANAIQHGILSSHLVLPAESWVEFDALLQQLMVEQQPQGTLELALVERMAVALWRQRRLVTAETAQLQLQQAELTYVDLLRIKQITGVDDMDWIQALARKTLPDLSDLQANATACDDWFEEVQMDAEEDLATLPTRNPRAWKLLAEELVVDSTEKAAEQILGENGTGLFDWLCTLQSQSRKLFRVVSALHQLRQAALQLRQSDVLSRYQTTLDNDLYKAIRVLRDMQRHRMDQAVINATPIEPAV